MTGTEGPMATWAFQAALSGLPDGDVRAILEGDRCPQPEVDQDLTAVVEEGDALVVYRTGEDGMWIRSDVHVQLSSME